MTSRFGTRTYSRQNKVCQSSIQFENVFSDKSNRPTAAKSAGILHKWGKTSFTSIRNNHVNGQKMHDDQVKRPKLALDEDPFSFESETESCSPAKIVSTYTVSVGKKTLPVISKPNKFFKSGNRTLLGGCRTAVKPRSEIICNLTPSSNDQLPDMALNSIHNKKIDNKGIPVPSLQSNADHMLKKSSLPPKTYNNVSSPCDSSSDIRDSQSSSPLLDENYPLLHSKEISTKESVSELAKPEVYEEKLVIKRTNRFFRTYSSSFKSQGDVTKDIKSVSTTDPVEKTSNTLSVDTLDQVSQTNMCQKSIFNSEVESDNSNHSFLPKSEICTPNSEICDSNDGSQIMHNELVITPDSSDVSNHSKVDNERIAENDLSILPTPSPTPKEDLVSCDNSKDAEVPTSDQFSSEDTQPVIQEQAEPEQEEQIQPQTQPLLRRSETEKLISTTAKIVAPILKTRRIFNSPKKIDKKNLYKHRPWHAEDDTQELQVKNESSKSLADEFDESLENETVVATLTRVTTWPTRVGDEAVTSIKCSKRAKEFYTVVRNVKQAHQCHESGETQEFNDDIEYLLDGLQNTLPVSTRCLSVISLAAKCMAPAFRMHLRAHGTISKIFSALSDAPSDQNLSLCTAGVMFILSQDRLNMDLERSSLELMLQLLESDSEHCTALHSSVRSPEEEKTRREWNRNKLKVRELCADVQRKGHARHLNLDNITAGHLAMEALLSLTSRRAGEWFKEELRNLGGLDHIVDTVNDCVFCLGHDLNKLSDLKLDRLRKIDRCLRVLENVTFMNYENQNYLIEYKRYQLIMAIVRVLKLTTAALVRHPTINKEDKESPGYILFSCLQSVLKVLLNVTHDNALGSTRVGDQDDFIEIALKCILHVPKIIHTDQIFDLLVLTLGLLINIVEHCPENRQKLLEAYIPADPLNSLNWEEDESAVSALINLFMEREEMARQEEAKTDSLLDGNIEKEGENKDGENATSSQNSQEDLEDTLTKALQKAGKHMEDSIIAAYVALLLGIIIQDNKEYVNLVKAQLPDNNFNVMVLILQKFLNFMTLTTTPGNTGVKAIQRVIDGLASS